MPRVVPGCPGGGGKVPEHSFPCVQSSGKEATQLMKKLNAIFLLVERADWGLLLAKVDWHVMGCTLTWP